MLERLCVASIVFILLGFLAWVARGCRSPEPSADVTPLQMAGRAFMAGLTGVAFLVVCLVVMLVVGQSYGSDPAAWESTRAWQIAHGFFMSLPVWARILVFAPGFIVARWIGRFLASFHI